MIHRMDLLLAIVVWCTGLVLLGLADPVMAQGPDDGTIMITYPAEGQQLSGEVQITGSAVHPAFASYMLHYDDLRDPEEDWHIAQNRVTQQVQDGELGRWDTTQVPDGTYRLRLSVFLTDGQIVEYQVRDLHVKNSEPEPLSATPSGLADVPPPAPADGLAPATIEQPPSDIQPEPAGGAAPDTAAADPGAGESTAPGEESTGQKSTKINMERVRNAFCAGVYLAVGGFVIMAGYVLLRGPLRPLARRLIWQIQDDLDTDR